MSQYDDDKKMEELYHPQIFSILTTLLPYLVDISVAPVEKDTKRATDFIIGMNGSDLAVRVRRPECPQRDLTIRAFRASGKKTELANIKEGFASRYLYTWADITHSITEWILVNLDRVRATSLLEQERPLIYNKDGKTALIAITIRELYNAGCLMAYQLNDPHTGVPRTWRKVNVDASYVEGLELARQTQYYPRIKR